MSQLQGKRRRVGNDAQCVKKVRKISSDLIDSQTDKGQTSDTTLKDTDQLNSSAGSCVRQTGVCLQQSKTEAFVDKGKTQSKYFLKKQSMTQEDCNISSNSLAHSQLTNVVNLTTERPERLTAKWFDRPCLELARSLLGVKFVRIADTGECLSGIIVETEAYLGKEDKAAHSYRGKQTDRNKAMYMIPGTAYVYNIYGIHCCINVSSGGEGSAVLIRSLQPEEGQEWMRNARFRTISKKDRELKPHELCNGPSKLTQAMGITKANGNQVDLATCPYMWMEDSSPVADSEVVTCKRIGINYAEEWTDKPLRFYVHGCKSVSIRDKVAEGIV